jgi:hypothetical protein
VGTNLESCAVKIFSSKQRLMIVAAAILLGLFLVRPGVSRLKARITRSISRAVGRPADIGSVHLRFLPRPGFDLENLVIYEDSAFGAEPMLRAPEVTAVVRLTSLVRGRLDIARLELTEPSLNLVRRADARWNWEDLLERTARTPLAPTAKSKSEARPGFPYIAATSGRINFKTGQEKTPYALLNADFAVWQESENTWGVRLKAEPLRTDISLSDTGLLQMNGTWQRAGSLRETPLQFSLEWSRVQLGQLTKLISGDDKGWRGEVRLDATLRGIPAAMQVAVDASMQDFHRYDISTSEGLKLAAHCDGTYSSAEGVLRGILCSAPVGNGAILLRGDAGLPGVRRIELALSVENVPVSDVGQLARRAKKDLPADLVATGSVQGNFTMRESGDSPGGGFDLQGHGEISALHLQSANTKAEVAAGNMGFVLTNRVRTQVASRRSAVRKLDAEVLPPPDEPHIEYGPVPVALGQPAPAQARGWVARSGYGMMIRGDGEVSHILRAASLFGLPAIKANVEGAARMDLQIAGPWAGNISGTASGFLPPEVTGTVLLRNLHATVRGIDEPVEIVSAELELSRDEARMEKLSARAADARWSGSVALPRGCGGPGACLVRFNLNSEEIDLASIAKWWSARPSQRRWYQMLSSADPGAPSFFQNLRAAGELNASRVRIHDVIANRVSASLELERGKLHLSELRADVFGGTHRGDWRADFTTASPTYTGTGTLTGVSLQQAADAMHDSWISGTASGAYRITASGADSTAFWKSAEGALQFDLRDGALSRISLTSDEGPFLVSSWQDRVRLREGKFEIEKAKIFSAAGAYEISGTASLGQVLDIKLSRGTDVKPVGAGALVYSITGTLAEPRVAVALAPETQARLKP